MFDNGVLYNISCAYENLFNKIQNKFSLNGSQLKTIAVLSMIIDHIFAYLIPDGSFIKAPWFTVFNIEYSFASLIRDTIGRLAFPIFAFLLVEGYFHTSSKLKYFLRLVFFAIISQIPWNMAHGDALFSVQKINVMVTLAMAFGTIWICDSLDDRLAEIQSLVIIGFSMFAWILHCDFLFMGILVPVAMFYFHDNKFAKTLCSWIILFIACPFSIFGLFLTDLYNGGRGFVNSGKLKYVFYSFYPAHLLVIGLIRMLLRY